MVYLTEDELILILIQALVKAKNVKSGFRKNSYGEPENPKIHVAIQGVRRRKSPVVVFSHEDANKEEEKTSQLRATLAEKHSTDSKAMSSYSVGHAMKKDESEDVLHFAGGVPLYKQGKLVGSVGVSGDVPEVDEAIAHAATENFRAEKLIQSDSKFKIPYISEKNTLESPSEKQLSPKPSSVSVAKLPPLPQMSSPPSPSKLPPLKKTPTNLPASGAPSLPPSPSKFPPLKTPIPSLPPSPSVNMLENISSLPVIKTSPLPPLKSSSTLVLTGSAKNPLPLITSSPKATKTNLVPLSSLIPMN